MSKRRKASPVVCGRRVCSGPCRRWRPITDYAHRASSRAPAGRYVLGLCEPCRRVLGRANYRHTSEDHIARVKHWKETHPELVSGYRKKEVTRRRNTPELREADNARRRRYYHDHLKDQRGYFREYRAFSRGGLTRPARSERSETMHYLDAFPLGKLLREKGITMSNHRQLAEKAGVSRHTVAKALGTTEPGAQRMWIETIDRICMAVGEPMAVIYD